jgi:CheY-like chemotaxis protein
MLVEDDAGDVVLTQEALNDSKLLHELEVAGDGAAALARLRDPDLPLPDLVLLDLNLPKVDGRQVLSELKSDERTSVVPVIVLTTSESETDVTASYGLHANAYVCKPVDFERFHQVIRSIDEFFLTVVRLPGRPNPE